MPSVPDAIGKYRVIRHLGEGGMGSVYLAHDSGIDRNVAIKVLRTDDENLRRRFQTEAQSAGRLKHANIVTVYEYAEFEGGPYLVMEFIEGRTVAQIIERHEPIAIANSLSLLIQACQGLAYAHRCGVVHRDVKPSNLMVDREGILKIVDFGIARTSGRDLTMTGKLVGTPAYMAPEQIQGEAADQRSDTFALGIVVFELLSGQCAYSGDSDYAVINRIVNGRPNAFTHADSRLETLLQPVIAKALARDPNLRHQSADALANDLAFVRSQLHGTTPLPVLADTDSVPPKILPVRRRRLGPIAAAAFAIMVALAAIGGRGWWPRTVAVDGDEVGAPQAASPLVQAVPAAQPEPKRQEPSVPAAVSIAVTPRPATPPPLTPPVDGRITARLIAAKAAEESGDYEAALAGYQEVLTADPRNTAASDGLASARRSQGRVREAAMKARIAEGGQKLGDGAYDDAIAIFESVLKQDSINPEALDGVTRARKAKAAEESVFKSRSKKPPVLK